VLGIDYGTARIGVAVSDALGMLAHPLEAVPAGAAAFTRIAELARARGAARIVVGLPRNMNGSEGGSAAAAREFAAKLGETTGLPILLRDERLSTVAAQRMLHDAGMDAKKSKKHIDAAAAQIILQTYLDGLAFDKQG